MKTNVLKTGLALALGFAAGAWIFHTPTAKAAMGYYTVTAVPMTEKSVDTRLPVGNNIMGFACVAPGGGSDVCYVLTK